MNITEAVNMILKRYPSHDYDAFMDLSKIKDDDLQEAVRFIASMRKSYHANPKRSRKINRETLRDMIKKGYTYKGIARETGLTESTVGRKVSDYGLKRLYHQMHPYVCHPGIRPGVRMICLNIETGEQKIFSSMNKAEKAFWFKEGYLRDKTKGGKCYIENGWEFRRGD
ncbi:MAG: hypothetical protein ACIRZM_04155 [Ligilactobacillus ruminis]